jgi:uncharacterized protein YggE
LTVVDPTAIEQGAVARAVENAYPHAEAVALVMKAQITALNRVVIDQIAWNADPSSRAAQPDCSRLTCTARVKVSYAFVFAQR